MALVGGQITGLGCYHGFWNMVLRVLHVLAMGAGTCDVVADMWKLSRVYPAQPISVPLSRLDSTLSNLCLGWNTQQCFVCILPLLLQALVFCFGHIIFLILDPTSGSFTAERSTLSNFPSKVFQWSSGRVPAERLVGC